MTINDLINPNYVTTIWNEDAENLEPFLGEMLFPYKEQLSDRLDYIKGSRGPVKPLMLSAYDSKAIPIEREGAEIIAKKIPYFKNSLDIDETTKRELMNIIATGNKEIIDLFMNEIYNDQKTLIERARVAREMMRMQALTSGLISFSNNGQTIAIDYEMSENNKVTPTNKWTDTTKATPIQDLNKWKRQISSKGGNTPTNAIMNSNTFALLSSIESIRSSFLINNPLTYIGDSRIKEYIKSETKLDVIIYDKTYMSLDNEIVSYIPDNVVILTPDVVGKTVVCPTPDEYDLFMKLSDAKVETIDNKIAITITQSRNPVVYSTYVSMNALPSFEGVDNVIVASVG